MGRRLSELLAIARQFLHDEFVDEDNDLSWEIDELKIYAEHCNIEISAHSPLKSRETLTTTADSRELDVSGIENLIDVEFVEYLVDQWPRQFRQVERYGDNIYMVLSAAPADDGTSVYAYCNLVHTLNDTTSTLNPKQELVLLDGIMAKAAAAKARYYINRVNTGSTRTYQEMIDWSRERLALYKEGLSGLEEVKQDYLMST
ncbi:MAG: hypothetical protein WC319_07295 [Candidatus Paceibacterota bacterium]|jgi:hypothetical protein